MLGIIQRTAALRFPGLLKVAARLPFRRAKAMKECFNTIQKDLEDIFNATAYHHNDSAKDLISSIMKANVSTAKAKDALSKTETMGQGALLRVPLSLQSKANMTALFLVAVATVAVAGFETTATTITWALHELSQNQAVLQRLREEIRAVVDLDGDACDLTDDHLHKMHYLDAFVVSRQLMLAHKHLR